jgi:hypothetical protein
MAARGGRAGWGMGPRPGANRGKPGRYGREEEEEERMEGVFLSRCVSFSFLGAGGNTLFWENLGKTLRPARRVASRHTSLRAVSPVPALRDCPVGFINPCRPGQLAIF